MKSKFIINNDQSAWIENALLVSALSLFSLLYLTLRGWTNTLAFVLFAIALLHFIRQPRAAWTLKNISGTEWAVVLSLSAGILAVLITQVLRQELTFKPYDGPLRVLLGAPVFLLLLKKKVNFVQVFQYICPLSLIILLLFVHFFPAPKEAWAEGRFGTYFVDPNTIGVYTMLLGFLCFFSIDAVNKDSVLLRLLKYMGVLAGFYLEFKSQTRGAWIAAPAMLVLWLIVDWQEKSKVTIYSSMLMTIIVILGLYFFVDAFNTRINSINTEVIAWINKSNTYTSAGLRLSFWQMSWILFKQNPFLGYGDLGYQAQLMLPEIQKTFSQEAISQFGLVGSHNEYLANMVRSGVFGLIAVLLEFCVPLVVFIRGLKSPVQEVRGTSVMGLGFVLGIMITAMSLEVLTLKYTNSFYGLMIAALCASVMWKRTDETDEQEGKVQDDGDF